MRKNLLFSGILSVVMLVLSGCSSGKKPAIENMVLVSKENSPRFSCTFDGYKHFFTIELPDCRTSETAERPLVIMLHGYGSSDQGFKNDTHFERAANKRGYGVVYVSGTGGGWNSGIGLDNIRDVDFIVSLTEYLQKEYKFDTKKTYVIGFSNGAFMVHRLMMDAPKTFSAGVSVAGKMTKKIWDERKKKNGVSVFQITGEKDSVVPKLSDGTAKTAKDPAIEEVMEYWAVSDRLGSVQDKTVGKGSVLTEYKTDGKKNQVWHLFVKDGRHSWPNMEQNGIDMNEMILDFFEAIK